MRAAQLGAEINAPNFARYKKRARRLGGSKKIERTFRELFSVFSAQTTNSHYRNTGKEKERLGYSTQLLTGYLILCFGSLCTNPNGDSARWSLKSSLEGRGTGRRIIPGRIAAAKVSTQQPFFPELFSAHKYLKQMRLLHSQSMLFASKARDIERAQFCLLTSADALPVPLARALFWPPGRKRALKASLSSALNTGTPEDALWMLSNR